MRKINTLFIFIFFSSLLIWIESYAQYKNDFRVTDDQTNKPHNSSRIAVDNDGNFVVVWQDKRNIGSLNPIYDIYFQLFNKLGVPQGSNVKVNTADSAAFCPDVTMRNDGSFVISWNEGVWVGNYYDTLFYYIKIYNKFGTPISSRILINDSHYYYTKEECVSIGILNNNDIICSFSIAPSLTDNYNVYIQKFSSIGQKIGNNLKVNDDTVMASSQYNSDIIVRSDNSFIVTWSDSRLHNNGYGSHDIFMQKYNTFGQKIGNNIKVNDDNVGGIDRILPRISCDTTGRFAIVWNDPRETDGSFFDVFCQFYNSDDTPSGSNIRVPFGFYEWMRYRPSMSFRKDGHLVIGWGDEYANGAGECPFFLRFSPSNQVIGYQHAATNYYPAQMKIYNDIALWEDRIITTWVDYRNGISSEIYASIISFQNPDSIISSINITPSQIKEFELFQNYPNPFNPVTKINYELQEAGNVKIIIYDILGRELQTLVNEFKLPGKYMVEFNGSQLSSGVYFYRIQIKGKNEFTAVKKMLLIR